MSGNMIVVYMYSYTTIFLKFAVATSNSNGLHRHPPVLGHALGHARGRRFFDNTRLHPLDGLDESRCELVGPSGPNVREPNEPWQLWSFLGPVKKPCGQVMSCH